jgi:hypothetical protein
MANKVSFHPLVAKDIRTAVEFYDRISFALGNRLRASVRSRFSDIRKQPELFGRLHGNLRVAKTTRFPYVILFFVNGDHVAIIGVFHAASDPRSWTVRANG